MYDLLQLFVLLVLQTPRGMLMPAAVGDCLLYVASQLIEPHFFASEQTCECGVIVRQNRTGLALQLVVLQLLLDKTDTRAMTTNLRILFLQCCS